MPLAIIHTSGTSGQPKGAVLTYGNFFYSAMASAYRLGHQPNDRWLCVLPLYHVGGLSILMRAVLYGITVDLHQRFDLDAVNAALDTEPITMISLVPTMLYRLLESRTHWPESLRLILLGGAGASPELIERCRALNLPVATTYGLTEAASQVATALPEDVYRKPGSVGKPLLFTKLRIVNSENETVEPKPIWRNCRQWTDDHAGLLRQSRSQPENTTQTASFTRATSAIWTRMAISSSSSAAVT